MKTMQYYYITFFR